MCIRQKKKKNHAAVHDVVLWGQLAGSACSYRGKGYLVYIEGGIQGRQWQATNGSARRTVAIIATRLQTLSSKSAKKAPAA
jgi:single-strand DNA-binding protein